tara:strand:+ start:3786 stop:4325 length:540 start_codon:yes stop_codon:yes gene_type:complete
MLKRVTIVTALGVTLWSGALVSASEPITDAEHKERFCMAEALFFETGNQPMIGILGAAEVILNRVKSERWPNTVCGVVHQGPINKWWKKRGKIVPVKWKCQFTYYCDGKSDDVSNIVGTKTWAKVIKAVNFIYSQFGKLQRDGISITNGATHYHTTEVNPRWGQLLEHTITIQDHKFFR